MSVSWSTMRRFSKRDNRISRKELRNSLAFFSRDPFGDVLAELLQSRPSLYELRNWAREQPDKWSAAVKVFANLYGYTEKMEVQHTGAIAVYDMSDAEILQKLGELRKSVNGPVKDLMLPASSSVQNSDTIEGTLVETEDKKIPRAVPSPGD